MGELGVDPQTRTINSASMGSDDPRRGTLSRDPPRARVIRGLGSLISNYREPGAGRSANRLAARSLSCFEDIHVGHDQDLLQREFRAIDTPHEAPLFLKRIHEPPSNGLVSQWGNEQSSAPLPYSSATTAHGIAQPHLAQNCFTNSA
jgi:hypothetical protein